MSDSLYKYLPPDRLDVLQHLALRNTQFDALNDPFEAAPAFAPLTVEQIHDVFIRMANAELDEKIPGASKEIREAHLKKNEKQRFEIFKNQLSAPSTWQAVPGQLQKELSNEYGTISLAANGDNLLMWSHYCNSLRGFVIEFDSQHYQFLNARKVSYTSKRPVVSFQQRPPEDFYLCKSQLWEYEQERRMFLALKDCDQVAADKYGSAVYLWRFDPASVKSVIIGERATDEFRLKLIQEFKKQKFPRASLRVAIAHESEFRIVFKDLWAP